MDAMESGYESDDDPISMQMLEDDRDGSQFHLRVNRREAHYKIRDSIKQRQSEWKGALKLQKTCVNVYTRCLRLL